jgi:hypothetical protein
MRKYLLVLCLIFGGCVPSSAPVKPVPSIDPVRMLKADIQQIACVRPSGTVMNRQVADYLAGELQKTGFHVSRQRFPQGTNIIGTRKGPSTRTIILGSHYDSVQCPGADDNASGCAVNLLVARGLAQQKLSHTLTVLFFDAEERSMVGSKYYARNMTETCDLMVNLDMVGNLRAVSGGPDDDVFNTLFRKYPWARSISFRTGNALSDHTPFKAKGIPVVWVFTGIHERHHESSDVPSSLNYEGMVRIGQYVRDIVLTSDKRVDTAFINSLTPISYQP